MTGSRIALTERGPGAKEQHTSCVTEELEEEDGIHTIEREA
jgi:hypothetical protein